MTDLRLTEQPEPRHTICQAGISFCNAFSSVVTLSFSSYVPIVSHHTRQKMTWAQLTEVSDILFCLRWQNRRLDRRESKFAWRNMVADRLERREMNAKWPAGSQ